MILHTVNRSPHQNSSLADCLALCADDDAVLLIEDGVYAAIAPGAALREAPDKVYALQADIDARGLGSRLAEGVTVVDDAGFVRLATEHDKVVSWY